MDTGDLVDGRFRLRDRLGTGGMAVVWRAGDEVLGRDVALKVLDPRLAHDPALLARVRDEARAVARLRHPAIVNVYDYGEAPGPLPYVVMEVAEGRSLSHLLSGGPLPWRVATLVAAQVAAALAAAHDAGVVHRDVKPGNVMVGDGRVTLVDFGISAATGDDDLADGQLLGTPAYLAPERLEDGVVRPATDVYALGLLLYRALAGRLPWDASTTTQMVLAHRYREPDPLPPIAGLPAEVAATCRRCLSKAPDLRPAAAEVAVMLAEAVGLNPETLELPRRQVAVTEQVDRTVPVRRTVTWQTLAWRTLPRRRKIAALAGAAVLLSGGIAAAAIPGGVSGPPVEAAQPQSTATPSAPARSTAPAQKATEAAVHRSTPARTTAVKAAAVKAAAAEAVAVEAPKAPVAEPKPGKGKAKAKGKKKPK